MVEFSSDAKRSQSRARAERTPRRSVETEGGLLSLQRTAGNQAVSQMLQSAGLPRTVAPASGLIQRNAKIQTPHGTFESDIPSDISHRMEITIYFTPGDPVVASKIGLIQIVRQFYRGQNISYSPSSNRNRTQAGFAIDRPSNKNNPVYGAESVAADKSTPGDIASTEAGGELKYQLGSRSAKGEVVRARLYDAPNFPGLTDGGMEFETFAVAIEGQQKGEYYGSVKWGYSVDSGGRIKAQDIEIGSERNPSHNFREAAQKWNQGGTRGVVRAREDCVLQPVVGNPQFKIAKGEELVIEDLAFSEETFQVVDGVAYTYAYQKDKGNYKWGWVETDRLEDTGSGGTKNMAIPLL